MDSKKTGEFIAEVRKEKRITQSELAELLGVTNKAVSRWETGEGFPEITFLPKLAQILGVSSDEILNGERSGKYKESSSNSKKYSLKIKTITFVSIMLMIVFYIASVATVYLSYYEWVGLLVLLVGLLTSVLLYVYNRYTYLRDCSYTDDDKMIIFKNTSYIYLTLIIICGLFIPLIILDPNYLIQDPLPVKAVLGRYDYFGASILSLPISFIIFIIVYLFHKHFILKRISLTKTQTYWLITILKTIGVSLLILFLIITYSSLEYLVAKYYYNYYFIALILCAIFIFAIIRFKPFNKQISFASIIFLIIFVINSTYIFISQQLKSEPLFVNINNERALVFFLGLIIYIYYLIHRYKKNTFNKFDVLKYIYMIPGILIIFFCFLYLSYSSNFEIYGSASDGDYVLLLVYIHSFISSVLFYYLKYLESKVKRD